jgi:hypothetical protein
LIWASGKASQRLPYLALDVHSGNVARKLGFTRKQNDGKALAELDLKLREFDLTRSCKI